MIEMITSPDRAEKKPYELFFVGLVYSTIALLLVGFVFSKDSVLSEYGGLLVVLFVVIASLPFMYFLIKYEENKDLEITREGKLLREHSKALVALLWLFLGFVVAFSFWYLVLPQFNHVNFNAQIQVFCAINSPSNFDSCTQRNGLTGAITSNAITGKMFLSIFANNVYVLMFTILFSLVFGAGAIFILAWNASVIGAAVGMFAKGGLHELPLGLGRYLIHGIPEISAYFIGALAGGILSVAIIRKDLQGERMWRVLQDSLLMVIISITILVLAAFVEVYVTPKLF